MSSDWKPDPEDLREAAIEEYGEDEVRDMEQSASEHAHREAQRAKRLQRSEEGPAPTTHRPWHVAYSPGRKQIPYVACDFGGPPHENMHVLDETCHTEAELFANAKLMAEAGEIHRKTHLTPRQLFERRDQLAEVLHEILNYEGGADSPLDDPYVMQRAQEALAETHGANSG